MQDETQNEIQAVSDKPEPPIYIAKRLSDAQRLEDVFKNAGIEYDILPEEYRGGTIFVTTRIGAFFYVDSETRKRAESIMRENGFQPAK